MEENIKINSDNNTNVYNYFTKNTVEEKIKETLYKKGLHRKEIVEYLSAESINEMISPEEWLDILELNDKKTETNGLLNHKLQNLSLFELGKKTENFFAKLGYKNLISNKGNFEGEMNIIGTLMENNNKIKMVAKCLFTEKVDLENVTEYIENLQHTKNSNKNFIIHFNGLDDKLPFTLKKKIILINKDLFASYLTNFRLL